jgi:hypothetical protein
MVFLLHLNQVHKKFSHHFANQDRVCGASGEWDEDNVYLTKGGQGMKRAMLSWIIVLFVFVGMTATAFAAGQNGMAIKGKEITITGQLTCTFCKLMHKTCEEGCCERCIKAGDPPLLTDSKGNQYILLTGEHEVPLMTPERYKMLGGKVTVKGIKIKGKGVQAIYVEHMEAK